MLNQLLSSSSNFSKKNPPPKVLRPNESFVGCVTASPWMKKILENSFENWQRRRRRDSRRKNSPRSQSSENYFFERTRKRRRRWQTIFVFKSKTSWAWSWYLARYWARYWSLLLNLILNPPLSLLLSLNLKPNTEPATEPNTEARFELRLHCLGSLPYLVYTVLSKPIDCWWRTFSSVKRMEKNPEQRGLNPWLPNH